MIGDSVRLHGAEFHHLKHVLRLESGATVALYDEGGKSYLGTIRRLSRDYAEVAISQTASAAADGFRLTLAQSLLKGRKMELVVEKVTELGVNAIVPFFSAFTVARVPRVRHAERLARWRRIAYAAAKQSGVPPPQIYPPVSFSQALRRASGRQQKAVFSEREQGLHLKEFAQDVHECQALYMMVGPEGGFATDEIEAARTAGFVPVSLGRTVLRAETASIAAVGICQFLWRDVGFPPLP